MFQIKAEIIGLNDMIADVKNSVKDAKINKAIEQVAVFVEGEAKRICPVDTGNLQKNIIHFNSGHLEWTVLANTNYASFLEYGTKYINIGTVENPLYTINYKGISSYRPFLRPAFYTNEGQVEQIMNNVLSEGENE